MGRKLFVSWTELRNLGKKTQINVNEMENIRLNFLNIINSLSSCWQGADANNFIVNSTSYFNSMKNDVELLQQWADTFNRAAAIYNGSVDDCTTYIRSARKSFERNTENKGRY